MQFFSVTFDPSEPQILDVVKVTTYEKILFFYKNMVNSLNSIIDDFCHKSPSGYWHHKSAGYAAH